MSKIVYNEGRVVGMSAYEEYVRQLKSVNPTFDVCTEREFLSASLAMGTSMVLKIPEGAGTQVGHSGITVYQVEFPDNCHLAAGNPVTGSFFYGKCSTDDRGWATVVEDYGSLLSNSEDSSPQQDCSSVTFETAPLGDVEGELSVPDTSDVSSMSFTDQQKQLNEYVKIVDGIVIQPGTWTRSSLDAPYKDFSPDLSKRPVLRITLMEQVSCDFFIQITGLTNRSILQGVSKFDFGATNTENKQDGDFLGCECYPWAAKVQFASSPAADYMLKSMLRRGSRNVKVETYNDKPLIKVTSNNLLSTYVYSRRSNSQLGSSQDNFGDPITTWEGTNEASHWYGEDRDVNVPSKCSDEQFGESGGETITTYNLTNKYDNSTPLGFRVQNRYESDDRNLIKNGDHGGWYSVEIDPYQLIKDFIDEVMSRFKYVDKRLEEIESEILNEINHRHNGDKYVLDKVYGNSGGSISQLVNLLNQFLDLVYDPDKELGIEVTWNDEDLGDDYDEEFTGTVRVPTMSWQDGSPSSSDGKIPRAKLNIYSGNSSGASATSFMRSRSDNSEDDLYAR